ncbi:helix-turn-helix domain-containing protein [Paenibacillus sp. OK076]|uniref:helix-turn-helix domain-containing protein n=1 Tax=Paenibacillus sp. OK076 TaxID=1884379 RepID=UPI0008D32808|nr:helix-turn-helix transcriptional regulator [Paenibacillus sp. OK076]SEP33513.1 Cro/C1-type HTH DNA-binding domain-containing protein [Paenibacillus sp. OK076]
MENIRETLTRYMRKHNMNHSRFSELSGINTGTLSRIIKGSNPISVKQLESITQAMGLAEDSLFDAYVEECFAFAASIRRIRPFIIKCAELGRLDCIERIVPRLLDNLSYVPALFEVAEELFTRKHYQAAALLYDNVSKAEKFQHSERLAFCRYRLFLIELGTDLEKNYKAAMVFEDYVNRLHEADQLEALKRLIDVLVTVHKWKKVDELAEEMLRIAQIQYDLHAGGMEKKPERPIYFYILYALLIRSAVCEEYKDYEGALQYVSLYTAGGSWVREDDEEARFLINQFVEWGKANTYLYQLWSGESAALHNYADFVADHPEEIFVALCNIVQAANQFDFDIDGILERFKAYIPFQAIEGRYGQYSNSILGEKYAQFLSDLAVYKFNKSPENTDNAINLILEGLDFSVKINSVRNMVTCMTLFEQYRDFADQEAKGKFKKLASEVHRINAEKNVVPISFV